MLPSFRTFNIFPKKPQVSMNMTLFAVEERMIFCVQIRQIEMLLKVKGRYLNLQEGKLETTEKMYKHHVMQVTFIICISYLTLNSNI